MFLFLIIKNKTDCTAYIELMWHKKVHYYLYINFCKIAICKYAFRFTRFMNWPLHRKVINWWITAKSWYSQRQTAMLKILALWNHKLQILTKTLQYCKMFMIKAVMLYSTTQVLYNISIVYQEKLFFNLIFK